MGCLFNDCDTQFTLVANIHTHLGVMKASSVAPEVLVAVALEKRTSAAHVMLWPQKWLNRVLNHTDARDKNELFIAIRELQSDFDKLTVYQAHIRLAELYFNMVDLIKAARQAAKEHKTRTHSSSVNCDSARTTAAGVQQRAGEYAGAAQQTASE